MFEDYNQRVQGNQDKFNNMLLDQEFLTEDDPGYAQIPAEIQGMYVNIMHDTYEGAIGWLVLSKLGFILTKQLNGVEIYRQENGSKTPLANLKYFYLQTVNKTLERVDKDLRISRCRKQIDDIYSGSSRGNRPTKRNRVQEILKSKACMVGGRK